MAAYVRVSTLEQAESGYSIGEQIDKLKKFADIKDWHLYNVYEDGGFSGSNTTRPALERLISDAKRHLFDTVLVYKLDRLSRSQKDTLFLIEDVFKPNDIDFVSLNENFDTSTAFGTAIIGILSVFAQLEREQIKERMKLGRVGRAKSGKAMGWHMTPFGYTYDKISGNFIVEPVAAKIVKSIFADYLQGMSITKLRDKLNKNGHIAKDIKWSYRTLRQTLDNPTYAGMIKYNNTVYQGNHEPLISKETFDQVQIELDKRQKQAYAQNNNPRPFQAKYMLSGLVRCGYCHAPLTVTLGNKHNDGTRLKKYQCLNRKNKNFNPVTVYNNGKTCQSGFYMMEDLESFVIQAISDIQLNPEKRKDIVSHEEPDTVDINFLQAELLQITKRVKKLSDLYINDLLSLDELKIKTSELKNKRQLIENQIKESANNNVTQLKLTQLSSILGGSNITDIPYNQQRDICKQLIKKVNVTDEEITIEWLF